MLLAAWLVDRNTVGRALWSTSLSKRKVERRRLHCRHKVLALGYMLLVVNYNNRNQRSELSRIDKSCSKGTTPIPCLEKLCQKVSVARTTSYLPPRVYPAAVDGRFWRRCSYARIDEVSKRHCCKLEAVKGPIDGPAHLFIASVSG